MYFAATSELFGQPKGTPQNEMMPFVLRSPYAVSKLVGIRTARTYRETYKLYMANGILFNHESEVRSPKFVTRKISMAVARIANGSKDPVILGNLSAVKDWGYTRDYVDGMWKILLQDYPDDFVLGTNESHTAREIAEAAFRIIGKSVTWKGGGLMKSECQRT